MPETARLATSDWADRRSALGPAATAGKVCFAGVTLAAAGISVVMELPSSNVVLMEKLLEGKLERLLRMVSTRALWAILRLMTLLFAETLWPVEREPLLRELLSRPAA